MKDPNKKNSHWKAKLITVLIIVAALLIIGIYLGVQLQKSYYGFIYNFNRNFFGIMAWGILIIAILIVAVVLYFVFRSKKKRK